MAVTSDFPFPSQNDDSLNIRKKRSGNFPEGQERRERGLTRILLLMNTKQVGVGVVGVPPPPWLTLFPQNVWMTREGLGTQGFWRNFARVSGSGTFIHSQKPSKKSLIDRISSLVCRITFLVEIEMWLLSTSNKLQFRIKMCLDKAWPTCTRRTETHLSQRNDSTQHGKNLHLKNGTTQIGKSSFCFCQICWDS